MTTNLTRGGPSAHQTGVLWRLVRASMTIVGLIPPLVEDGELLVRPAPRLLWLGGVVSWGYLRRPRCRRPSSSAEAAGARLACRRACGSAGPARMGCRTAALFPNSSPNAERTGADRRRLPEQHAGGRHARAGRRHGAPRRRAPAGACGRRLQGHRRRSVEATPAEAHACAAAPVGRRTQSSARLPRARHASGSRQAGRSTPRVQVG